MDTFENDATQAAMDEAVARMVAASPHVLTPAKSDAAAVAGPFVSPNLEPSERFRLARERRAAFDRAMAALRSRGRADTEPIAAAVAAADTDGIVTAAVSFAVGAFCDQSMNRDGTVLHSFNVAILNELQAAIWADAARIIDAVPDDGSAEVAWILAEARDAVEPATRLFDGSGRPAASRRSPLSLFATLVRR